jgi:hypothetical protein
MSNILNNPPVEAEPHSPLDQIKALAVTAFRNAESELDEAIHGKNLAVARLAKARADFTEAEQTARRVGAIPKVGRKPKAEVSK